MDGASLYISYLILMTNKNFMKGRERKKKENKNSKHETEAVHIFESSRNYHSHTTIDADDDDYSNTTYPQNILRFVVLKSLNSKRVGKH